MNRIALKASAAAGGLALLLANASGVFAQWGEDFGYEYGYETGASGGVSAFFWIMWCCAALFGLGVFAFNI